MNDSQALLWLTLCPGLKPLARKALLRMTQNPREAVDLARSKGFRPPSTDDFRRACNSDWIDSGHRLFPSRLQHLNDAPEVLFYRGQLEKLARPQVVVAIVGTRRPSENGRLLSSRFSRYLSSVGLSVASGLALGVDTAAHWASLEGSGGLPVAVVGCGLDQCYPAENAELLKRLEAQGIIFSEYPPGSPPNRWHFPARNRILAALSHAILVIEAPSRSGALSTANHGLEMGREIFTLPGPMDHPNYQGNLTILQEGASLVRSPHDLLSQLCPELARSATPTRPGRPQSAVDWSSQWKLPLPQTLAQLTLWELHGRMQRSEEGHYFWVDALAKG